MKAGVFTLTKNEQRVVIVLITLLLGTAFIRYWRAANGAPNPNQHPNISATATPFPSLEEDAQSDQE
jgi:hypothetical protein